MKLCYGLMLDANGNYAINNKEADTVRLVFHLYQHGLSLGKISEHLEMRQILSPTGKLRWRRAAIDKMLSNQKYIAIIGMDEFLTIQVERDHRSNVDEKSGPVLFRQHIRRFSYFDSFLNIAICKFGFIWYNIPISMFKGCHYGYQ